VKIKPGKSQKLQKKTVLRYPTDIQISHCLFCSPPAAGPMAHHYSLTRSPSNPSPTLYPLPSAARSHRDPTDPPCHPPSSCSTHPRSCQNATAAGGGGKRAWRWPTAMTTPPTLWTRRLLLLVTVVRDRVQQHCLSHSVSLLYTL
jgi:hypothetical protein